MTQHTRNILSRRAVIRTLSQIFLAIDFGMFLALFWQNYDTYLEIHRVILSKNKQKQGEVWAEKYLGQVLRTSLKNN